MIRLFVVLFFTLTLLPSTFAQVGGRGGGRLKEVEATQLLLDLIPYLQSPAGLAKFPEITHYNRFEALTLEGRKETFFDVMNSLHFVMVNGPVVDSFRGDRDCVTYIQDPKRRITRCNQNAFPALSLDNQRTLYTFVLHEAFIATGIEKPLSPKVNSVYPVASRLSFYKKNVQVWAPGEGAEGDAPDAETDFFSCRALDSHFRVEGSTHGISGAAFEMSLGSSEADRLDISFTVMPLALAPKKIVSTSGSYYLIEDRIKRDNEKTFHGDSQVIVKIKAPWFQVPEEEINRVELRGSVSFTRFVGDDFEAIKDPQSGNVDYRYVEQPGNVETVELVCKVNPKVFVEQKEE